MNEIIAIGKTDVNGSTIQTVSARDLHAYLEVGRAFGAWISERIVSYNFNENSDFVVFSETGKNPVGGGRPTVEYHITLDMAKELAMVERNDRGKQARQYFIECERRAKTQIAELSRIELLRMALDSEEKRVALEQKVIELEPKAEFHDAVTAAVNDQPVAAVAKIIGTGEIRFFRWLKETKVLMGNNLPYQQYLDAGYFHVIERQWRDANNEPRITAKTMVTGKGVPWLQQRWAARAA